MHHQVKALEMEVAFDGYWLESAQATALLSDLSDAHLMVCTQKLAQLQAMRRGWAERERATEIRAQAAASFASTAPKMVEENPGGREAPRKHSILDTVTKVITLGRTSTASGTQEGEAHEPSQQRKKSAEDIRDEVEQDFASSWRMNAVQDTSQVGARTARASAPLMMPPSPGCSSSPSSVSWSAPWESCARSPSSPRYVQLASTLYPRPSPTACRVSAWFSRSSVR